MGYISKQTQTLPICWHLKYYTSMGEAELLRAGSGNKIIVYKVERRTIKRHLERTLGENVTAPRRAGSALMAPTRRPGWAELVTYSLSCQVLTFLAQYLFDLEGLGASDRSWPETRPP